MKHHDKVVKRVTDRFKSEGCECSTNEPLGLHKPDLKCCDAYIEVKATPQDLRSTRTKHQLRDIGRDAAKLHKPAVLYNDLEKAFIPLNNRGKLFIDERQLDSLDKKTTNDEIVGLGAIAVGAVVLDLVFNECRGTRQVIDIVSNITAEATNWWNANVQPYRY